MTLLCQNSCAQKCQRQRGDSAEIYDADFRDASSEIASRQQMHAEQVAAPSVFQSFDQVRSIERPNQ